MSVKTRIKAGEGPGMCPHGGPGHWHRRPGAQQTFPSEGANLWKWKPELRLARNEEPASIRTAARDRERPIQQFHKSLRGGRTMKVKTRIKGGKGLGVDPNGDPGT